jgi:glycosyltransferase involved in cell wall biosynthesis
MARGTGEVWGVGVVRNEVDIIALSVRVLLEQGIDRILILDNGSTDGTVDLLADLARACPLDWSASTNAFRQDQLLTRLAQRAYLRGADWVLPFDADEFWLAPGSTIRAVLGTSSAGALSVQPITFVQRREQHDLVPDALRTMTRRVADPVGRIDEIARLVDSEAVAFVEHRYAPKWISRAAPDLRIGWGNHSVAGVNGALETSDAITCLHAALRAREILERKLDASRQPEEIDAYFEQAWHLRRWRRVAAEGRLDAEWRANSYDEVGLDVFGRLQPLVVDERLRDLVSPYLASRANEAPPSAEPSATVVVEDRAHVERPRKSGLWGLLADHDDAGELLDSARHHLALGFDRILIAGPRSSAVSPDDVSGKVVRFDNAPETSNPGDVLREASRQAWRSGASWVVPLLPGERLRVLHGCLTEVIDGQTSDAVACRGGGTAAPGPWKWFVRCAPDLSFDRHGEPSGRVVEGLSFTEDIVCDRDEAIGRLTGEQRNEILDAMEGVNGWFSRDEGRLLMSAVEDVATRLGATPEFVEIGSYQGRSTVVIAGTLRHLGLGRTVFAIDPHLGDLGARDSAVGTEVSAPTGAAFRANLTRAGLREQVVSIERHTFEVEWSRPIGLLFVDGLHDRESVFEDTSRFIDSVVPGGLIAFHDYSDLFPGVTGVVTQFIDEGVIVEVGRAGTLIVLERTPRRFASETTSDGAAIERLPRDHTSLALANATLEARRQMHVAGVLKRRLEQALASRAELAADVDRLAVQADRVEAMQDAWTSRLALQREESARERRELAIDAERRIVDAERATREAEARAHVSRRRADSLERQLTAAREAHQISVRGHAQESRALHEEVQRQQHEVRALRQSWSWRVTYPLRRALDVLTGAPAGAENADVASAVATPGHACRILVVSDRVPTPDEDSGSFRIFEILKLLRSLGHDVVFAADNEDADRSWIPDLEREGLRVIVGRGPILDCLSRDRAFDYVVLSRPSIGLAYLPPVRALAPHATVVYDSVDLHWIRLGRQAVLSGSAEVAAQASEMERVERLQFESADIVICISEEERRTVLERVPDARVELVPNVHPPLARRHGWESRSGLLFVGGFWHAPNEDAMHYFVRDILPLIHGALPGEAMTIIGSHMPASVSSLASPLVHCVGYVEDLAPHLRHAKVFVAPLRYGAGMKGKVGQSLAAGLPVVTTRIGAEGLDLSHRDHAMIADSPDDFARAVVEVCSDPTLWEHLSISGASHIEERCGTAATRACLESIFTVQERPPLNRSVRLDRGGSWRDA